MNNYFLYSEKDLALMSVDQKINLVKAAKIHIDKYNIRKLKHAFFYKQDDLHSDNFNNMLNTKVFQDFLKMTHEAVIDSSVIR